MKKFLNILMLSAAALMLFGCTPSTIRESGAPEDFPDGVVIEKNTTAAMTLPETSKYTIPADAETGENGGPGAMETTAVDRSYYPEDKQHGESVEENGTMIIVYIPGSNGISASLFPQKMHPAKHCQCNTSLKTTKEESILNLHRHPPVHIRLFLKKK